MHKKIEIQDLDIPIDDVDCWNRYPKYHWVYDLSRLLDAQNIKWSPFEADDYPDRELNMPLYSKNTLVRQPGYIYMKMPEGQHMFTEVYITKGEVKMMRHVDRDTNKELPNLTGEIELRLYAFITLHFQKFTGIIGVETYSNEIFRIQLRSYLDTIYETNQEIVKLVKRIYKKNISL